MEAYLDENVQKSLGLSETREVRLEFVSPTRRAPVMELMNLLVPLCASGTLPPIRMNFIAKGLNVWIDLGKQDQ